MNTIQILIIIGIIVAFFAFMVHVLTKMHDRYEEIERALKTNEGIVKSIRKQQSVEKEIRQQTTAIPQINVNVPQHAPAAAEQKKAECVQSLIHFESVPTESKQTDPDKPKRKSPVEHSVLHHSDEYWLNVCREYQVLKHKNPNLTQTDFVKMKNDPAIKIKTFNAKMYQLTKNGVFQHKPRKK